MDNHTGPLHADLQKRYERARAQNNALLLVLAFVLVGVVALGAKIYLDLDPAVVPYVVAAPPPQTAPLARGPRWEFGAPPGARPTTVVAQPTEQPQVASVPPTPDDQGMSAPAAKTGPEPVFIRWSAKPPIEAWAVSPSPADAAWFQWMSTGAYTVSGEVVTDTVGLVYNTRQGGVNRLMPPYGAFVCAIAGEAFGGLPVNDALAVRASEGNANNMGPFRSSVDANGQVLAQGPYQFTNQVFEGGLDTWEWTKPYPEADIQDDCDAVLAANNLFWYNKAYSAELTLDEYVFRFTGCYNTETGKHDCRMWNNHVPQATEAYWLSRRLACTRSYFWGAIASLEECR